MKESDILQLCRLEASKCGAVLSRNNSGKFEDKTGRWVTFGLFSPGGADLIGWRTINGMAQFVAFEVKKTGGRIRPEQQGFIDAVLKAGGIAGIVYGPEDVRRLLCS